MWEAESRDRGRLQDAYEQTLIEIVTLTMNGQHDQALEILHLLEREDGSLDENGWLNRSLLSHKGLILADCGDLPGALQAYRQAQGYGPGEEAHDLSEYVVNQLAIARILDRMGDVTGAVRELETGLDAAAGPAVPTAFSLLVLYAQIARRSGLSMPARYGNLWKLSCERLGIPLGDFRDTASLIDAVLGAAAQAPKDV